MSSEEWNLLSRATVPVRFDPIGASTVRTSRKARDWGRGWRCVRKDARMRRLLQVLVGLMLGLSPFAFVLFGPVLAASAANGCATAGASGMTAKVVATNGQNLDGSGATLDATGCDIGVYVGPTVTGVTIQNWTIKNAKYHAIFVQDTARVRIEHNIVKNNVPDETFPETKAVQATGSNMVTITNNTVVNNGGGGIGITDDGSFNPGGPNAGLTRPGNNNVISGNTVGNNTNGCGIVVSSYNEGEGVNNNVVFGNLVYNNPAGIVVAADTPNTTANDNRVSANVSVANTLPGIIVHSNAPGDVVDGNLVSLNWVSGNAVTGILFETTATGATLSHTSVVNNRITNQPVPYIHSGDTGSVISGNRID